MSLSEDDIFNALKSKKYELAFNLIVKQYQGALYNQIRHFVNYHHITDDLLQEVLIKIWKNLPNFKMQSKFSTWAFRIAVNECLGYYRKEKNNASALNTEEAYELIKNLRSDIFFSGDEIQSKLQSAIAQLPDKQRIVFNLKYFQELKYDEMVQILGGTVGSIKASYHHASKKIEEFVLKD
jgi:RNA polymerase sigma-70 factor (ECF subfamily)